MNYEKEYKKLVDAVKVLRDNNPSDESIQNWVSDNVPELRESENEKIRKTLIEYFNAYPKDYYCELKTSSIIAWLKKQGTSYTKRDVDDAYLKGVADTKNEIEKQYEANYQIRKDMATFIFNYRGDIKDRAKWMDYLGINVCLVEKQGEQKPLVIDEGKAEMDYCFTKMMNGEKINPAWGEEDDKVLGYILNDLRQGVIPDNDDIEWLKSLKDRYTWKPSEEQLNALNTLNLHGDISYVGQQKQLIELYEQLKKL